MKIITERILDNPAIGVDHSGKGELLVFLHGIGGNRTNWREQVELFSDRFHAVAWDGRGYGLSDDYDGPLDFRDFARDLARLLDHFGAEAAHLCGLSMGGRIAQDFYDLHPQRVRSLALVATFFGSGNFTPEQQQKFLNLRLKPLVEEGREPKDIAANVAKSLVGPHASEAMIARFSESMAMLHKDSYVKALKSTTRYDRLVDLAAIKVPTLLVFGENDRVTPPRIGVEMAKQIPDCCYEVVPRSGHLVNMEEPEIFNRLLVKFLSTTAKTPSF